MPNAPAPIGLRTTNRPTTVPLVGGRPEAGRVVAEGTASQAGSSKSATFAASTVAARPAMNVSPHPLQRMERPAPASGIEYRFAQVGFGQVSFSDIG